MLIDDCIYTKIIPCVHNEVDKCFKSNKRWKIIAPTFSQSHLIYLLIYEKEKNNNIYFIICHVFLGEDKFS